ARRCAPVNQRVLDNPQVNVAFGDGREFLLTMKDRYDLVVSEPSNPYRAGIASLFTREYYEAVKARLDDGGMLVQWMQAYEIDAQPVLTIHATLASVFPHVELWQTQRRDLLFVASAHDVAYDVTALRERVGAEPFRTALKVAWRTTSLEGVLA